jgi:hypothetical protein
MLGMVEMDRELIAYVIIGIIIVVSIPLLAMVGRRRRREKLRRRGIKTYGH